MKLFVAVVRDADDALHVLRFAQTEDEVLAACEARVLNEDLVRGMVELVGAHVVLPPELVCVEVERVNVARRRLQ